MTVSIKTYNNTSQTRLTGEIWRSGENQGLCGHVQLHVGGEDQFEVGLVDTPSRVQAFCEKHNIEITKDDRTGVERYLDGLAVAA